MAKQKTDAESALTEDLTSTPGSDALASAQQRIAELESQIAAAPVAAPVEAAPPVALGPTPEDAEIVGKMIARKKTFEAQARVEHEKTFQPLVMPKSFRLSERAYEKYQEWAKAADAAHPHDTRLDTIFGGLVVMLDRDLPGESVIVSDSLSIE